MADQEPAQPPLVALTEDEVAEYQRQLPLLIGELEALKTKHAGLRSEMKQERSDLQTRINNIAQQLRDSGR
jgi:hypothetical protein